MKLAYSLHFEMGNTLQDSVTFSDTVATKLLELDRNDNLAWEILCGALVSTSSSTVPAWTAIDELLETVKSPTGAYFAGLCAHTRGDRPQAQRYLSRTGDHTEPALRAKIALAEIAHSQGSHQEALEFLQHVSTWAPHHPLLPKLTLRDMPTRPQLPRPLAPRALPVDTWSADTRNWLSNVLREVRSGTPSTIALSRNKQYAKLDQLLQHDSALFTKCREAARALNEHAETLRRLIDRSNPLTWTILPWSSKQAHWSQAVHIHEALNPDGHRYVLGQLVDLLNDIERAASTLDPWM